MDNILYAIDKSDMPESLLQYILSLFLINKYHGWLMALLM